MSYGPTVVHIDGLKPWMTVKKINNYSLYHTVFCWTKQHRIDPTCEDLEISTADDSIGSNENLVLRFVISDQMLPLRKLSGAAEQCS